jgi:hypothetical protein
VLEAAPNPAAGDVLLRWRGGRGAAVILVSDMQGKEIARFSSPASASSLLWRTAGVPCGTYLVSVRRGASIASAVVTVE